MKEKREEGWNFSCNLSSTHLLLVFYPSLPPHRIFRVDKTSPLHSHLLLGKVEEIVNTYARVVTKFGTINTLISPTQLYPWTATTQNIELDYTTELTFSAACKKAMECI